MSLRTILWFSLAHFLLFLVSLLAYILIVLERLRPTDHSWYSYTYGFVDIFVYVITLPLIPLWGIWASQNLPYFLIWVLGTVNSLIWGTAFAWLYSFVKK